MLYITVQLDWTARSHLMAESWSMAAERHQRRGFDAAKLDMAVPAMHDITFVSKYYTVTKIKFSPMMSIGVEKNFLQAKITSYTLVTYYASSLQLTCHKCVNKAINCCQID